MAGQHRLKNGVASARLCPAIHVRREMLAANWTTDVTCVDPLIAGGRKPCQKDLIRRKTIVSRTATAACQTG
jgi:deoxyhypusine synthase